MKEQKNKTIINKNDKIRLLLNNIDSEDFIEKIEQDSLWLGSLTVAKTTMIDEDDESYYYELTVKEFPDYIVGYNEYERIYQ